MTIRKRFLLGSVPRHHAFHVEGSPISVNRYGSLEYRDWRATVHASSVAVGGWTSNLYGGACAVRIRYFRNLDRAKDVDNILKAILDGLDGKVGARVKVSPRVLSDDRTIEHVASQRTDLKFHKVIDARSCHRKELAALVAARRGQAAIFVWVGPAPDHTVGMAT
jgi:hypothetical protein